MFFLGSIFEICASQKSLSPVIQKDSYGIWPFHLTQTLQQFPGKIKAKIGGGFFF